MRGLVADERALGLQRIVVPTSSGPVAARVGGPASGPGLLLIHGAAGSWTTWTPLLQQAEEDGRPLSGVVALDLPGWGESPDPPEPLDAVRAASVVAEVARAAGHRTWTVVGHSLGGFVALQLAAQDPAATTGVVLVSPTGPAVVDAVRRPVSGGARLPWFAGMLVAMRTLAALPGQGRRLLAALDRSGALAALSRPLFADRRTVHPSVPAALAWEIRPRAFVAAAKAGAAADLRVWTRIACPVRSVRGVHDVFAGARDAAALGRLIPDFQERVVPGAGHFAAVEQPEAVLAALDAVLPASEG